MMENVWFGAIGSTLVVSILSFSGVLLLAMRAAQLQRIVFILVSFAIGALFGNTFFILIPESFALIENTRLIGILIVSGLVVMFILEKMIHWHHCHHVTHKHETAPLGYISLITDSLHNFTDGVLIAAAWMASPGVGIATTIAVVLHEIPQEISDFGVLLHAGFSRKKALFLNFVAACAAILGAVVTILLGNLVEKLIVFILPFAAGGFIYLAGSDLIPELHKESKARKSWIQLSAILAGIFLMFLISMNHSHDHGTDGSHGPAIHNHEMDSPANHEIHNHDHENEHETEEHRHNEDEHEHHNHNH
jgi:zinc and cadmium transporter